MSTDTTVREVFESVDVDPDAVLEEFGCQSPDDIVADGDSAIQGDHDPTRDDELDADDTVASDLFADLSSKSATLEDPVDGNRLERKSDPEPLVGRDSDDREAELNCQNSPQPDASDRIDDDVVLTDPTVTVLEGDGAILETMVDSPVPNESESTWATASLVGSDPEPVRLEDDDLSLAG